MVRLGDGAIVKNLWWFITDAWDLAVWWLKARKCKKYGHAPLLIKPGHYYAYPICERCGQMLGPYKE
jgi:hypothetical protein